MSQDLKSSYLASPPLVVAYAIAGTMNFDLYNDALGEDQDGNPVYLRDIWPSDAEIAELALGVGLFMGMSKVLITLGLEPESMETTVLPTPGSQAD